MLVTGNVRLSQALLKEYEQMMLGRGFDAWLTPDVLPWKAWLLRVWEDTVIAGMLPRSPLLLNTDQELHLWESIINEHADGLLQKQATARQASEAWRLLRSWCIDANASTFSVNEDTQAFYKWQKSFDEKCRQSNWLPEGSIAAELIRLFKDNGCIPLKEIVLVGFDELTPLQQQLLNVLTRSEIKVSWIQPAGKQARVSRIVCDDAGHETDVIGRWTYKRLLDNPHANIGIVVPDLAAQRRRLEHALRHYLMPETLLPGPDGNTKAWNISLGLSLSHYPIIQTAFKLLSLLEGRVAMEELCELMGSPYLAGSDQEAPQRFLLDRKLRDLGEPVILLKKICYYAGQTDRASGAPKPWACPELLKRFNGLHENLKECPAKASAGSWALWFANWLKIAGWSEGRSLSSDEYQAVEAWRQLLATFGSLETVAEPFSKTEALGTLCRMASDQIFQPQSSEVSIHVLGLYEAIGLEFDYLWVMGLRDDVWPPAPRPNPFIPLSLQLKHGLPHAEAGRELAVAKGVLDRLKTAGTEVVMSNPGRHGDECFRPSPLIMDCEEVTEKSLNLYQAERWQVAVRSSARLEEMVADDAPPLTQTKASGGSAIFKYQALCPFRAFAEHRLGARPLRQSQIGLDAMKRGTLLHRVLELFWTRIESHAELQAMDNDQLGQAVVEVVRQAVTEEARKNPLAFTNRFKAVETHRLFEMTLEWLAVEKQRAPFKVIALEKEVNTEINGVGVHLWVDRIDQLLDGRKVIVDYKTGKVTPSHWFGERPDEPQLPLYSAIEDGDIAAVLFGQIKAGDLGYKGVVQDEDIIQGLPPSRGNTRLKEVASQWPAVLIEWKETIAHLASDFKAGHASVDPKKGTNTCESSYCELMPLCRIHEQMERGCLKPAEGDLGD